MTTKHPNGSHDARRKVMSARHSTKIALVVTCLVALAAGSAALARTPGQPNATQTTAPLYTRVLSLGDLKGFWSVTCPVAETSAAQWSTHSGSETELSRNGFVNGLREPLRSSGSSVQAWSAVAQFTTAAGARREALSELGRALGRAVVHFTVPKIPGSLGYSPADGRTSRIAVGFTEGRFQYLIEISGAGASDAAVLQARLTAAAVALYERALAQS
jgi:hypothetical protein